MRIQKRIRDESGMALVVAMLLALVVAAISVGAAMMSSTAASVNKYNERLSVLEAVADDGLELARSAVNLNSDLYPAEGYNTIESDAAVTDASGATIPDVRRTTYVGPTGITSGQYGVFGSIVTVVEDAFGNKVVRRGEIVQESFAKFAYFTTIEGNIWFGGGDQIWGPVHTNDRIQILSSGAWFHSTVVVERVDYAERATFDMGYTENGPKIPMPTTADLDALRSQGAQGNTSFIGNTTGGLGEATTRLYFVNVDLNGDGDSTDANEGFVRVYQQLNDAEWVSGDVPEDYYDGDPDEGLETAVNCGHYHADGLFYSAADHPFGGDTWENSVTNGSRCFLGGADEIWNGFDPGPDPMGGSWLPWPGVPAPAVVAARAAVGDAQYLFPINRAFNPSFKGVIFVDGDVVVSGTVRGRITIAATGEIVIGDDLVYATNPGAGVCADMVGLFAGTDVVIADNTINAPVRPWGGQNHRSYDDTRDEFIHAVVLALNNFTAENWNTGSTNDEPCQTSVNGRGCIFLTGGIIQRQRGAVGTSGGTGYVKRYSYDQCVLDDPPPYFPTTGRFSKGRYFEVDPVGFDVARYYQLLTPQ